MEIEQIAKTLIYIHATFGGIALLTGGIALVVKKGNNIHKKSGKIFYYAMLTSACMAFVISVLPNHESPFLFAVGVFSAYFILSGYRSLKFKEKKVKLTTDKIIAVMIIITGLFMVLYPIIKIGKPNIILLVFGIMSLLFGIRDLKSFRNLDELKKRWLTIHLGKMTGGYISAVSAFFVVNQILPGIWNWFVPGIIGSVYIAYWGNKMNKKKKKNKAKSN